MSFAGRPRKPTALHLVEGTARPARLNPRAPAQAPLAELPAPPKGFTKWENDAWRELAGVVGPLRVMTEADVPAFRQLVVTLALAWQSRAALKKHGLTFTVTTESGEVIRKRPEVEILLAAKKQLSTELSRFGLTPADREKVSALGKDGAGDPLDEFAVGGPGGE